MYSTLRPERPAPRRSVFAGLAAAARARGSCRRRGRARAGRSCAPLWSRAAGRRSPAAAPRRRRAGALRCAARSRLARSILPIRSISSAIVGSAAASALRPLALIGPASRARRFSPKARMPSRRSSEEKQDSRSATSPASCCSLRTGRGVEQVDRAACCRASRAARWRRSRPPAATDSRPSRSSSTTSLTSPIRSARAALEVAAGEEQLLGPREPDRVEELAQAGVAVDQAELRRRHPQLGAGGADPQVAGDRQLEAAAEAVAVDRGHGRPGVVGDRLHRGVEGMGDERLGVALEGLLGDRGDVVAGGEDRRRAGDEDAAGLDPAVQARQRLGDRVEDLVVERVAALGVVDAQPRDRLGGAVEKRACRPRAARPRGSYSSTTRTSPSLTDWPSSQRISFTVPSSSDSTGISIFIDSRMTTVSPSAI